MSSEMLARIDAWIADQPGYISRQEAARRRVELALSHAGPSSIGSSPHKQADAPARGDKPPADEIIRLD